MDVVRRIGRGVMGGMVGDARKRQAEAGAAFPQVAPATGFRASVMEPATPGGGVSPETGFQAPVADETLAEWRALLTDERCLCSSASTDWQALDALLAEIQSLRVQRDEIRANRDELARKVSRLRASLASAWSAYLEVALDDRLEDGTLVLQLALGRNPELRSRLAAVLDGGIG